jgi:hypothetical protein
MVGEREPGHDVLCGPAKVQIDRSPGCVIEDRNLLAETAMRGPSDLGKGAPRHQAVAIEKRGAIGQ